ncbi:MAG: glycoside hydrolase [Nitrospirales bacterium]|nr:MAG: glycoside hydrolase [Nitrospirales bacterium]
MNFLVLTTDYPPLIGGISRYSFHIAKNLSKFHRVTVVTPHIPGDNEFDQSQEFETIRVLNVPVIRELLFAYHIIQAHLQHPCDCLFNAMWFPCGILSFFLKKILNINYLVAAHASEMLDDTTTLKRRIKRLFKPLKLKTFRNASMNLPVSTYTRGKLLDLNIPAQRIAGLPNGVDIERLTPGFKDENLMKQYHIHDDTIVLLTVGRLDLHKGHDVVVQALPLIQQQIPNVKYLIVGNGPEEDRLTALIARVGMTSKVKMIEWVSDEDLVKYYRLCDVYVMPSREIFGRPDLVEGFGIAFLEANACAKPVVAGHSGGVPDAVIHGQTGLLVNPLSHEDVASAVIRLCQDTALAEELGQNGLKRCRETLNWPMISRKLVGIVQQINGQERCRVSQYEGRTL